MYEEFYHFKENPFNVTSDPVFFFLSSCHSQAFSHLTYGIEHRKGILLITGEVGTGKTTLCRTLLDKYRNHKEYNVKTALILNPSFLDQQLLQLILRDFGIPGDFKKKFDLVNALNEFLLEETGKGNNIVLIIDEAQNLGVEELEQIRLLSSPSLKTGRNREVYQPQAKDCFIKKI
jgi:general secretion pathway protein A